MRALLRLAMRAARAARLASSFARGGGRLRGQARRRKTDRDRYGDGGESPDEIINRGLAQAIEVMNSMIVNEGQETVLEETFIPEFVARVREIRPPLLWLDISCSPYCSFMSETVETGNQIMRAAYEEARIAYFF